MIRSVSYEEYHQLMAKSFETLFYYDPERECHFCRPEMEKIAILNDTPYTILEPEINILMDMIRELNEDRFYLSVCENQVHHQTRIENWIVQNDQIDDYLHAGYMQWGYWGQVNTVYSINGIWGFLNSVWFSMVCGPASFVDQFFSRIGRDPMQELITRVEISIHDGFSPDFVGKFYRAALSPQKFDLLVANSAELTRILGADNTAS